MIQLCQFSWHDKVNHLLVSLFSFFIFIYIFIKINIYWFTFHLCCRQEYPSHLVKSLLPAFLQHPCRVNITLPFWCLIILVSMILSLRFSYETIHFLCTLTPHMHFAEGFRRSRTHQTISLFSVMFHFILNKSACGVHQQNLCAVWLDPMVRGFACYVVL